jgi:hypothetical protein
MQFGGKRDKFVYINKYFRGCLLNYFVRVEMFLCFVISSEYSDLSFESTQYSGECKGLALDKTGLHIFIVLSAM